MGEILPLGFNFTLKVVISSGAVVCLQNSLAGCTQLPWVYTNVMKGRIWFLHWVPLAEIKQTVDLTPLGSRARSCVVAVANNPIKAIANAL